MTPERRKSIHRDERAKNENLKQCNSCAEFYLVKEDEVESKLSEEYLKTYYDLQKKKETPVDEKDIATFQCRDCSLQDSPKTPTSRRQSTGGNVETTDSASPQHAIPSAIPLALQPTVSYILPTISTFISIKLLVISVAIGLLGGGWMVLYNNDLIGEDIFERLRYNFIKSQSIPVNVIQQTAEEEVFDKELYGLEKVFTKQVEDTWIIMAAGIKSVVKKRPNEPSVFLMLYDSESGGKTAQCLAQEVSKPAIKYLMNRADDPHVLKGKDINQPDLLEDSGLLLKQLNDTVRRKGALVVEHLQDVSPTIAKSFHFLCDKYSPLVQRAVLFFTLKVDKVPSMKVSKAAQESLKSLWSSKLEDNVLHPLITRMTPNVVSIYPDSTNC